jgi:hypothetical protein
MPVHIDESKTRNERDHETTPTVRFFLERAAQHRENVAARYEAAAVKLEASSHVNKGELRRSRAAQVRAQNFVFLT